MVAKQHKKLSRLLLPMQETLWYKFVTKNNVALDSQVGKPSIARSSATSVETPRQYIPHENVPKAVVLNRPPHTRSLPSCACPISSGHPISERNTDTLLPVDIA